MNGQPKSVDIAIERSRLLLVEGNVDKNFFEACIKHLDLHQSIEVLEFRGVDNLASYLGGLVKSPQFAVVRSIGIIRDADESIDRAFQSVQTSIRTINRKENINLSVPEDIGIWVGESPLVGVMICADEHGKGMLESLLLKTLVDDPKYCCVKKYFKCLDRIRGESRKWKEKSYVHAYLSSTETPNVSVGVAAKKGIWNLDHPALTEICNFLRFLAQP